MTLDPFRPVVTDWKAMLVIGMAALLGALGLSDAIDYMFAPHGPVSVIHRLEVRHPVGQNDIPKIQAGDQISFVVYADRFRTDCRGEVQTRLVGSDDFEIILEARSSIVTERGQLELGRVAFVHPQTPPGRYRLVVSVVYDCEDGVQFVRSPGGPSSAVEIIPAPLRRYGAHEELP